MTTTTEDIMKLAFNASHAETEHSADKWFAQLRTAVESLVEERDAAIADSERLNWLQANGEGYALVSDDFGRWCCSQDGMQNVPENIEIANDIQTTHFIMADEWKADVRSAIDAALRGQP